MPWPVALGGALVGGAIGTALVTRILVGIGVGIVTYIGVQTFWESIQAGVWSSLGGVSANILTLLQMARVDDALTVVFSAGSAKLTLKGLTAAGKLNLLRWKFND